VLVIVEFQMCNREPNSMNLLSRYAFLILIVSAAMLHAQSNGTIKHADGKPIRQTKAENGLIISWVVVSAGVDVSTLSDAEGAQVGQVDIFDERGQPTTSFNVLRPVEGARSVSIEDVSARPGGPIAVAALYTSKEDDIASSLMLYDAHGTLQSAFALPPIRSIRKLAVDESSNIWTLTDNFDEADPPVVPMVVEYSGKGAVLREELPRSALWSRGIPPKEGMYSGRIAMGSDTGVVWIWLPGSTDLVVISAKDGTVTTVQTALPKREKYREDPLDIALDPSGNLVGVFREDGDDGESELAYYAWSPIAKVWSRFKPGPCDGERLLGVGKGGQIYHGFGDREGDICAFGR
jgi:hypothetical protein